MSDTCIARTHSSLGSLPCSRCRKWPADRIVRRFHLDALAAAREVMPVEQHRSERRHQPVGNIQRRLRRMRLRLRLERAEHADTDAQHVHRMRAGRQLLERSLHARRQTAQAAQALLVVLQFGARRQLAVQQQIRHLFELALRRKIEDVVAAIVQVVAGAADGAKRCVSRRDPGERNGLLRFESGSGRSGSCLTHSAPALSFVCSLAKSSSSFCS